MPPRSGAMPSQQTLKLAAIGTLAGAFSGLFGVGGGTVIVPLLIFWFGYGERLATGTSLAAIVLIGALGALAQGGIYGNVHLLTGLALALPAVLGFSLLPARTLLIVAWISQTFIQLVMLAVLQLGQNISGAAADKRAQATYLDAESILHECLELQRHLQVQDASGSDVRTLLELNNALTEAIHQKVKAPAPVTAHTT